METMHLSGGPWSPQALLTTFAMWVAMMALMMLPSALPFLRMVRGSTQSAGQLSPTAVFSPRIAVTLGYLVAWSGFSAVATLLQGGLGATGLLGHDASTTGVHLTGLLLAIAGAYQFAPWKQRLLARCVHPLGVLLRHPGRDVRAMVAMGMHYGVICVGCCAPMMLVLFTVGVMNLPWVLALTAFVFAEKLGLGGGLLSRGAGVALLLAAVATLAR